MQLKMPEEEEHEALHDGKMCKEETHEEEEEEIEALESSAKREER